MNKEVNDTLVKFWDQALTLSGNEDNDIPDYKELAPSSQLYDSLKRLSNKNKILDYGCGYGWASIILLKENAKNVLACDMTDNILKTAKHFAKLYEVDSLLNTKRITENFFNELEPNTYDGIFCSNVLDVIPLETSLDILKGFSKLASNDSTIIIGMNYYFDPKNASGKDLDFKDNKYLFMNGVLRLTSLTDDEWKDIFSKYFKVEKLEYFAWPGEAKPTRRLFTLKKI